MKVLDKREKFLMITREIGNIEFALKVLERNKIKKGADELKERLSDLLVEQVNLTKDVEKEELEKIETSKVIIEEYKGKQLDKEGQSVLLKDIQNHFDRRVAKSSSGLSQWLKYINVKYKYKNNADSSWADLIIEELK